MVTEKTVSALVAVVVCISCCVEPMLASGPKTKGWPSVDYSEQTFDVARKSSSRFDNLLEEVGETEVEEDEKLQGHGTARSEEPTALGSQVVTSSSTPSLRVCDNGGDQPFARDCADLLSQGVNVSGIYSIFIGGAFEVPVYCDMTTDGGGWTVFQKRFNGSENFYRTWADYATGFGKVSEGGEYWLGNDNIRQIILGKRYTLRVDMSDFNDREAFAQYSDFQIGAACENYLLISVGTYSGTAGDSLSYHVGMGFTTHDKDNDAWQSNCATLYQGAWWYRRCHGSNLNGAYLKGPHTSYANGIEWYTWLGYYYSLKTSEMKIRPAA